MRIYSSRGRLPRYSQRANEAIIAWNATLTPAKIMKGYLPPYIRFILLRLNDPDEL